MSAKPLSRELSTALRRPSLFVLQGCRKLSRVPRASCFRIRHRFTRRPFRAQLPPPSCHSLGYLRSLDPSLFVDDPSSSPVSSSHSYESFSNDRRNLAGIDNHGDGAVPVGFSPPKLTASFARKHPRRANPSFPALPSVVYGSESTRNHLRRNNSVRFYLNEYHQLTRKFG